MADGDFIGVEVSGVEEARALMRQAVPAVQKEIGEAVGTYMVNSLKLYPQQRRVSRARAYPDAPAGPGWFSEKQRRWFFANLGDLQIPYRRTQQYAEGWKKLGSGANMLVVNEAPHAIYMQDDRLQSRMAKLGGWVKLSEFIKQRGGRITEIAIAAAKKALRRLDKDSGGN